MPLSYVHHTDIHYHYYYYLGEDSTACGMRALHQQHNMQY